MPCVSKKNFTTNGLSGSVRICDSCDISFKDTSALNRHWNTEHNPNFVGFPCPSCTKICKQKSNLGPHLKTHTHTQDLVCGLPLLEDRDSLCTFKCGDPSSMIRHTKNVHKAGEESCPAWMMKKIQERKIARTMERRLASEKVKLAKKAEARVECKSKKTTSKKARKTSLTKYKLEVPSPTGFFEVSSSLNNYDSFAVAASQDVFGTDQPIAQPQPSLPIPSFSLNPEISYDISNLAANLSQYDCGYNSQAQFASQTNTFDPLFDTSFFQQTSPSATDYYGLTGSINIFDYSPYPNATYNPLDSLSTTQFTGSQASPSPSELDIELYNFNFGAQQPTTSDWSSFSSWPIMDNNVSSAESEFFMKEFDSLSAHEKERLLYGFNL